MGDFKSLSLRRRKKKKTVAETDLWLFELLMSLLSFQDNCLSVQVSYLAGQPLFAPIRIDL